MTREIKFRAWDKEKKEMREVTGINWYDEYIWVDETPMSGDKLPIESTPIMQFTGLKDKNGKEIYEFDQLKGEWDVVNDIYLGTVEFYGGAFRIKETGLPLAWADKDKDCEVVGNKFEGLKNPSKGDIM